MLRLPPQAEGLRTVQLKDWDEKSFITQVLGRFATTARPDDFDDSVIIDLGELTDQPAAPLLVYSMDQPSFVPSPNPDINPFRFNGRWISGRDLQRRNRDGCEMPGFSLALASPPDLETSQIEELLTGITDVLDTGEAAYQEETWIAANSTRSAWPGASCHGRASFGGAAPGQATPSSSPGNWALAGWSITSEGTSCLIS